MSFGDETRNLLTFALLQLDPRTVDKRTVMNITLLEIGLLNLGRVSSIEDINSEVDNIVGQNNYMQIDEAKKLISRSLAEGRIQEVETERYILGESIKEEYSSHSTELDEAKEEVSRNLLACVELELGETLDEQFGEDLINEVIRIITENIYQEALRIARDQIAIDQVALDGEDENPLDILNPLLAKYYGDKRILAHEQIKNGILDYFQNCPTELKAFLKYIHHNVLITQILNIDPLLTAHHQELFAQRRIYLDTNVVLANVFEGQKDHSVVSEIIDATRVVGVSLLVSEFTIEELRHQVERAKSHYRHYERNPLVMQQAAYSDDAILKTFVRLKAKQQSLEWNAFIAPFENIEEVLLEMGILFEDDGCEVAHEHPKYSEIQQEIQNQKSPFISTNVVQHDALNACLINRLQEKYPPDERGQVVWLLTIDRSLRKSQRVLFGSKKIDRPYCIQAKDWGDVVIPLQSINSFIFDDFIGYLAQIKLGALANPDIVQLDFLETIRDAEVDVDRLIHLHPEQARAAIIALQRDRDARAILNSAQQTSEEHERQTLQAQFANLIETAIEETDKFLELKAEYDERIRLLNEKIEHRETELRQQRDQLSELEEKISRFEDSWIFRFFRMFHRKK